MFNATKQRRYRRRRIGVPRRTRKTLSKVGKAQVYPFCRFVNRKVTITGNDTLPSQFGGIRFSLNDVPGVTEFTALFDQYKIAGVAYRWVINRDVNNNTIKNYPRLIWTIDNDDDATPSALTDIEQYPKMKEFFFSDARQTTRWYYMKPARAAVEWESAVASSYRPQWKGFIDCASPGAAHFGLKYGTEACQNGVLLYLQCKYYLVMKNVR